ncbi:MAG: hypothetical protein ABFD50_05350 [Smithella sp.]
MMPVNIHEVIPIIPPYNKIYRRLGFRKKTTKITIKQKKETDFFIEKALSFISLRGCTLREFINNNDGDKVTIGKLIFESKQLARFLFGCRETLFMGATAGNTIMEAIADQTATGNFYASVIYDATASEMTDAALNWLMNFYNSQLRREGKKLLPRRVSAGYSDINLEYQKKIYEQLEMQKIGVIINHSFILRPEKSVTAITGIYG